jgi:hypothetical protein
MISASFAPSPENPERAAFAGLEVDAIAIEFAKHVGELTDRGDHLGGAKGFGLRPSGEPSRRYRAGEMRSNH